MIGKFSYMISHQYSVNKRHKLLSLAYQQLVLIPTELAINNCTCASTFGLMWSIVGLAPCKFPRPKVTKR